MFLEDSYWGGACDNSFSHNLAVLAAALYYQTQGLILTRIEAESIRRDGVDAIDVVSLDFVESNGDMNVVAPLERAVKPFPVRVIHA